MNRETPSFQRRLEEITTEVMLPTGSEDAREIEIDVAGATAAGHDRSVNEDRFLIAERAEDGTIHLDQPAVRDGSSLLLLAVADGLGGLEAGEVASTIAVRSLARVLARLGSPAEALNPRVIREAFTEADDALRREGEERETHMATTCTVASILWPRVVIAHVGDSRCLLARGIRLHRITTDHTLAAEVEKRLDPGEERLAPLAHVVTRALGSHEGSPEPDLQEISMRPGDRLLLCTDGLTDVVEEEQLIHETERATDAFALCRRLVRHAGDRGGTDDATVVAGFFDPSGDDASEPL